VVTMVVVEEMQKGRIRDLFIPRHVTQIVASWLVHVDLKYKRNGPGTPPIFQTTTLRVSAPARMVQRIIRKLGIGE